MLTNIYDPQVDAFLKRKAADAVQELRAVEAHLKQATMDVEKAKERVKTWRAAALFYLEDNGIAQVDQRFSELGATQAIDLWADEHDEIVPVRELAAVLYASGSYPTKKKASNALDGTLRKNRRFQKIAPGVYKRLQKPGTKAHLRA